MLVGFGEGLGDGLDTFEEVVASGEGTGLIVGDAIGLITGLLGVGAIVGGGVEPNTCGGTGVITGSG